MARRFPNRARDASVSRTIPKSWYAKTTVGMRLRVSISVHLPSHSGPDQPADGTEIIILPGDIFDFEHHGVHHAVYDFHPPRHDHNFDRVEPAIQNIAGHST